MRGIQASDYKRAPEARVQSPDVLAVLRRTGYTDGPSRVAKEPAMGDKSPRNKEKRKPKTQGKKPVTAAAPAAAPAAAVKK